ncbi:hypothetical protein FALBO_14397 [Fusarium albosuccineum]|uniref:Rhodopsin domain-containing protein n=1 Tax=Fusarium albosuccineum TaxID=1237068 RepID=A0A8H4P684_9HYPO|nr:hypothetical protein FALBO_14397 [Fusarium albosuccineum]
MTLDPNVTTLPPTGLAVVLLVVTLLFVAPCTVVVLLRCWIRTRHGVFGTDDGLMFVGWVLFMCVVGIVGRGTYSGVGMRDESLNAKLMEKGRMYLFMFQIFYCCSLLFIKGSICVTLLRIAVDRIHRIIAWATLIISCISTFIVVIGLMAICRPISAMWTGKGECSAPVVITSLSYFVSATAVLTDWICAILPAVMLYKAQMKKATKISISIILGLGVVASIATIARLPYIAYYANPDDYLYNVANIGLWSVIESGTGIIGGSLPSLRRLVKNWINFDSSVGQSPGNITPFTGTNNKATVTSKVTAALGPGRSHIGSRLNTTGGRDWKQLDDASSSREIYVKVDVEMQSLERPGTSMQSAGDSLEELRMHHA